MSDDDLAHVLREEIAKLVKGDVLSIVEFDSEGIVAWQVRHDRNGTPVAWYWPGTSTSTRGNDTLDGEAKLRELMENEGRLLCVVNSIDGTTAGTLEEFEAHRPDMSVFPSGGPVSPLLRDAITKAPLTHRYELVVLRRSATGRPLLDGYELFAASTLCPRRAPFSIRCGPGDGEGTVFAVVATVGARNFRLVSAQTADVDPGVYQLTAELVRPGVVRFHDLPVTLRPEHRSWQDLVAQIPQRLAETRPTHLICAIEINGTAEQIGDRVDRARELVKQADDTEGSLRISLITYGAHSFDRKVPDEAAAVVRWGITRHAALAELGQLGTRRPVVHAYPRAAQVECVLALLIDRLGQEKRGSARRDRPVLVTVGFRPAFPPKVDPRTTILPCPSRNDWRTGCQLLTRTFPDMAFGAIYDGTVYPGGVEGEFWRQLGSAALVSGQFFDPRVFAADLELRMSAQGVPFPLAETGGS